MRATMTVVLGKRRPRHPGSVALDELVGPLPADLVAVLVLTHRRPLDAVVLA
jgi:hypothetical protein